MPTGPSRLTEPFNAAFSGKLALPSSGGDSSSFGRQLSCEGLRRPSSSVPNELVRQTASASGLRQNRLDESLR